LSSLVYLYTLSVGVKRFGYSNGPDLPVGRAIFKFFYAQPTTQAVLFIRRRSVSARITINHIDMNKPFSANVDYKFAIRRRGASI